MDIATFARTHPAIIIGGVGALGLLLFRGMGAGATSEKVPDPVSGQEPGNAYVDARVLQNALNALEQRLEMRIASGAGSGTGSSGRGEIPPGTEGLPGDDNPYPSPSPIPPRPRLTARDLANAGVLDSLRAEIAWSNN